MEIDKPSQSQSSSSRDLLAVDSSNEKICRICHEIVPQIDNNQPLAEPLEELVAPCKCIGSIGWVHPKCLQDWLTISKLGKCEVCKYSYTTILKPPHWIQYFKDCWDLRNVLLHIVTLFSVSTTTFLVLFILYYGIALRTTLSNLHPTTAIVWSALSILLAVATTIASIFSLWNLRRHHRRQWECWRKTHPRTQVFLVLDKNNASESTLTRTPSPCDKLTIESPM